MTVGFLTLGCKVNQYETNAIRAEFIKYGYEVKEFDDICDVYVINTCSVTGESDRKSRQQIRKAKRNNPNAIVCVCGCFSQVSCDEVMKIDEADIIIGTKNKTSLVGLVNEYIENKSRIVEVDNVLVEKEYEENCYIANYKTRAEIKIQDGCDNYCAYCVIPYARGHIRSRSLENIKNEAKAFAEQGFKEIILAGICLSAYGKDLNKIDLADAVMAVNETEGIERIRLGSLEPVYMTKENILKLSRCEKLCAHFHLSLQSGCDETLKRMKRKYTVGQYAEYCALIREHFENAAITTDIMVGFPGESEEEFAKTLEFVKKIGFSDAHVFCYSKRKNTLAEKMPLQVDNKIKKQRSDILINEIKKLRNDFYNSNINKVFNVLAEMKKDGYYEGYSENYIPVRIYTDKDIENTIVKVKVTRAENDYCIGEMTDI